MRGLEPLDGRQGLGPVVRIHIDRRLVPSSVDLPLYPRDVVGVRLGRGWSGARINRNGRWLSLSRGFGQARLKQISLLTPPGLQSGHVRP